MRKEKDYLPSLKVLSIISFGLLIISAPLFIFKGGTGEYVREYFGLIWHISMFFFISKLPVPEWGKKAGTYWIILDILSGILYLNNFYGIVNTPTIGDITVGSMNICLGIRLAAHIFEGIWLISSSLTTNSRVIKVCGILAGFLIALYSIVSPFAPTWVLNLNMPFMVIWFLWITLGKYE